MKSPLTYQRGDKIDGRYFVHQALEGGRGEVYLCLDLETSQAYALKTVSAQNLHDKRHLDAFYYEAAIRVALENHGNIVRCYRHSTIADRPFMFLEWVLGDEGLGRDLGDWIRRNKLDLQRSLNFAIHICNGLIHAGDKVPGIVHGWLKPGNLLVGKGGLVKINGFGQSVGTQGALSVPIAVSAAPYQAPEQWEGSELDPRTDLYALGCNLFEMLSGSPPFEAETTEEFRRLHLEGDVPLLAEELKLPTELDVVLSRCLAKNKEGRFSSPREFLSELSNIYQKLFPSTLITNEGEQEFGTLEFRRRVLSYASLERYDDAIADLGRAQDSEPQNTDIYYERGLIYEQCGYLDKAISDFTRAIELDPSNDDALSERGNVYRKLHQYELALDDQRRALGINPDSELAYARRGHTYLDLDRNDEALEDFNRAITLNPSPDMFYFNRGSTLMKLERFEEAVSDFTRCVGAEFGEAKSYTHRAAAYVRLGRYEEAMGDVSEALSVNASEPSAFFVSGDIHTALRQYDAALKDYSAAIEHGYQPLSVAYLKRGVVYLEGKNYQSAILDLTRATELDPQLDIAYGARAEAQHHLGRYMDALVDINRAMDLGAITTAAETLYIARSKTYWGLGDYENALADANRALAEQSSEVGEAFFSRGNAYSGLERFNEAIKDYSKAIEYDPTYAMAFSNRGASYARLEDFDRALCDLIHAIRLDPKCAIAYRNIGGVLNMKGAKERAMVYFAAAVRLGDAVAVEPSLIISAEVLEAAMASGRRDAAHKAFTFAGSFPDTLLAVAQFPFLTAQISIASKERALGEMTSSPLFSLWSDQLKWLKACADDTPLPDVEDPKLLSADEHEESSFIDTARAIQAVDAYDAAIKLDEEDSALLVNKGVTLGLLGQIDDALACYRQALHVDPSQKYAYYFMGLAQRKLGDLDQALKCFDRALEIAPDNSEFWSQKARIFSDIGMDNEEIACYDRVLAVDPSDETALINKGVLLGRKGEYLKVVECMERALQEDPELELAWFYKGQALLSLERNDEAIPCFDRALEIDPAQERTWMMKGEALRGLGRDEDAALCFIKLTEFTPKDTEMLEEAGDRLFTLGKLEDALRCYEQALEVSPQSDEAWLGRGTALGELGRPEEAIACFDSAIELNPDNILAWFNKGVILVNGLESYSEAISCFERAEALGHKEAGQIIVSVKETQAAEAFEGAESSDEMRRSVSQLPLIATPEFLMTIERAIEDGSFSGDKNELAQRVEWLREIIKNI